MITNRKNDRRLRRKKGIRNNVRGSSERYRLSVYRSLNHIYAQIIDDDKCATIAAASSKDADIRAKSDEMNGKIEVSKAVGALLAERAKNANISTVVFDRNGYVFHGRVRALADAAREGGLQF